MRIQVGLPALAIVALLAGNVFVLTQSDKATPVTLEQAVERFRDESPTASVAEDGSAATPDAAAPASTAPGQTPAPTQAAGRATAAVPAQAATAQPFAPPAEGVYAYRTSGRETISMGGASHDYPERTFATARRQGGCRWEVRHELLKEHVERAVLCSEPGQVLDIENSTDIVFFGQKNSSTFRCEPPQLLARAGDQPGASQTTSCRSAEDQAKVTTTFVGRERLTVGGVTVDAVHIANDGVVSGRATGTSHSDSWLHPDSGLLLKQVRTVSSRANAFGSTVDYHEDASFELERLDPLR
jgi:hypothetical protein